MDNKLGKVVTHHEVHPLKMLHNPIIVQSRDFVRSRDMLNTLYLHLH